MANLVELFKGRLALERSSPNTINNYDYTLRDAERFLSEHYGVSLLDERIKQVEGNMLDSWINELGRRGVSDASKIQYIRRMDRYLSWAYDMGNTKVNLSAALPKIHSARTYAGQDGDSDDEDLFAEADDSRVYSDEDIILMLQVAAMNPKPLMAARNCAIVAMLAGTGLRASELASLNVRNIRRAQGRCIRVRRKGGKGGTVAIAEFAMPYLEEYLAMRRNPDDSEPLFLSARNHRLDRVSFWKIVSKIQKQIDVKTGLHNFRHTVLTQIAENNSSGVAAMIAGHSSRRVTEKYYIHPTDAARVKVIDGMSINAALKSA